MQSKIEVEKLHTFTGHRDSIYSIQLDVSRRFLFSASGDGMIVKWDLENPQNGEVIAKVPNSIYAMHFLNSVNLLLAAQNYEGIHLLDWQNKREVKSLKLANTYIFDIKSFNDLMFIASGDGLVTVINLTNWSIIAKINGSSKSARTIAINPLTHELAIGYSDYYIRIYDLYNYTKKYEWMAHQNSVFSLEYSQDFKTLWSASRDARINTWQVNNGYSFGQKIAAHLYAINSLAFSPNGKNFATGSMDKSVKIWESNTLQLLKVLDKARHAGHGTSVNKVLWTDNNHILSAGDDRTINYWKVLGIE